MMIGNDVVEAVVLIIRKVRTLLQTCFCFHLAIRLLTLLYSSPGTCVHCCRLDYAAA